MLKAPFKYKLITAGLVTLVGAIIIVSVSPDLTKKKDPEYYKPYLDFLATVYDIMEKEYYAPVDRYKYEQYIEMYKRSILSQLNPNDGFVQMIAWRGAGLMIEGLRTPEDHFTAFIPPKIAKEYSKEIYGKKMDIGISGTMTPKGYSITFVEKRSESFKQGIRTGDMLLEINDKDVKGLKPEDVVSLLQPLENTKVKLKIISPVSNAVKIYEITPNEYFKETVFKTETNTPGVFCLRIPKFNQMTSPDLEEFIRDINKSQAKMLIIDLRSNPGGPPLAVKELAAMFIPPQYKLFYYQKKNTPLFGLTTAGSKTYYTGPLMIMIDRGSGSASEVMAGTFKAYKRAVIVGQEPTAGMAYLKSTHNFPDGSMLALLTGTCFLFNGEKLGSDGVIPDLIVPRGIADPLKFVIEQVKKNT
ncbi:MAG TPA: S41 family peptidase [Candidatus Omnitrophota bacterium]|nr:S41 family peptidase [Candidatus Omnitrophota bacterium]HPS19613.1 S41 family peptidase [Candidatus Omnitrophota bacterium]